MHTSACRVQEPSTVAAPTSSTDWSATRSTLLWSRRPAASLLEALVPAVVADSATGAVRALTPGEPIGVDPAPGESWAYLAVRGGFEAEPVLGSRSWDSLSKLGPQPPQPGQLLAAGNDPGEPVATDWAPHPLSEQTTVVRVRVGPRADWFTGRGNRPARGQRVDGRLDIPCRHSPQRSGTDANPHGRTAQRGPRHRRHPGATGRPASGDARRSPDDGRLSGDRRRRGGGPPRIAQCPAGASIRFRAY